MEVLHERRPPLAGRKRIVGVGNPHTLVGCQVLAVGPRPELVELLLLRESVVTGAIVGRHARLIASVEWVPISLLVSCVSFWSSVLASSRRAARVGQRPRLVPRARRSDFLRP